MRYMYTSIQGTPGALNPVFLNTSGEPMTAYHCTMSSHLKVDHLRLSSTDARSLNELQWLDLVKAGLILGLHQANERRRYK